MNIKVAAFTVSEKSSNMTFEGNDIVTDCIHTDTKSITVHADSAILYNY